MWQATQNTVAYEGTYYNYTRSKIANGKLAYSNQNVWLVELVTVKWSHQYVDK